MSARSNSRSSRRALTPQEVLARTLVAVFFIAIFLAVFVLPWMF